MSTELPDDVKEKLAKLDHYEKRFADLVKSFKKLTSQKKAADAILRETTPLRSIADAEALEAHLKNLNLKNEMSVEEIKRLTNEKLEADKKLQALQRSQTDDAAQAQQSADQDREHTQQTIQELQQRVIDLTETQNTKAKLEEQLTESVAQITHLQHVLDNKTDEARTLDEQHQQRVQALKAELKSTQEQQPDLLPVYEVVSQLMTDLGLDQLVSSDATAAHPTPQNLESLTQHLKAARRRVVTLEQGKDQAHSALETVTAAHANLEVTLSDLRVKNQRLTNQLAALSQADLSPSPLAEVITQVSHELAAVSLQLRHCHDPSVSHTNLASPITATAPAVGITSDHQVCEARLASTVQELELVRAEHQQLLADSQQRTSRIASLEHETQIKDGRVATLTQQVTNQQNQVAEWEANASQLEEDLKQLRVQHSQLMSDHQACTTASETTRGTMSQLESDLQSHRDQVEAHRSTIAQLEQDLQVARSERDTAASDLTALKQKHSELESQFVQQKQALNAAREHLETSDDKVLNLTDQLSSTKRQIKQQASDLTKAQDSLMQANKRLQELEVTHEQLKTSTQQQLDEAEHTIRSLTESQRTVDDQQQELAQTKEQLANLQSDLDTSRQLFEDKSQQFDRIQSRLHEKETEYKQLVAAQEKQAADADRIQQVLRDELASHRRSARQSLEQVRQSLAAKEEELTKLRQDIQPRLDTMTQVESDRDALERQLSTLRTTIQTLEQDAVQHKLELEELRNQTAQWTATRHQHEQAMEDLTLREAHWRKVNRDLKKEVKRLQRELRSEGDASHTSTPALDNGDREHTYPLGQVMSPRSVHTHSPRPTALGSDSGVRSPRQSPIPSPAPEMGANGWSMATARSRQDSSASTAPPMSASDSTNITYLRHVMLKFLEAKDHRAQLIPVLAMLLQCTPDEVQRLRSL
ncbi:hypothetical protein H4R34_004622 [Dimargaris verticillata]|uniref:GRIP domain-containing protein n=1 Tax=Dimargaris verticillata TaxID=2761393 RepID=A0A9W8AYJ6_9FUNG|nr:hypothetical protein H4R34_004622 [Dimargaris verticillata]